MSSLEEFLSRLLHQGRVVFRERPAPEAFAPGRVGVLLERAFASYRLEVAGPLIDFDARVAFEAGALVREACWALVSHEERVEGLGRRLAISQPPTRASHHLSADLVFRYLPQVHRRARAFDPADPLVALLADVLRQWPLSGVLSDLEDGPPVPPDLGGHEGLMLLYAERLASHDRPGWQPEGRALEYVELVRRGRGRDQDRERPAEGVARRWASW